MKQYYAEAIAGTLQSPQGVVPYWNAQFTNNLVFPITMAFIADNGQLSPGIPINPGATTNIGNIPLPTGTFLTILSAITGAFVGVVVLDSSISSYDFTPDLISAPNDIGPIPQPTTDVIIPPSSQSVIVGAGTLSSGNIITREQSWQRMGDSYTIVPGQTRTVGTSMNSGMSQTSSDQTTVSESVSTSASAGWGPASASISASLSSTSTSMQSYTITEEKTSYESSVLASTADYPIMILRWQICDVITVIAPISIVGQNFFFPAVSSVVSLLQPAIAQEYNMDKLPAARPLKPLSKEVKEWWYNNLREVRLKNNQSDAPVGNKL